MNYIFIEILNNSLITSLLIIAVIIVRMIIKKAPKWFSCVLWGLVAIKLVFPFSIESVFSLVPSAKPIPSDIEYSATPQIESGVDAINRVVNPVLEHEMAHLRRFDHLWKPLGFVILALYWFNPLCWVAYILLCKDIELACDEKVTRDKDKEWKATYCQALLACNTQRRIIAACPVAFGEVSVKDRVKSVLNYKKPAFWINSITAIILLKKNRWKMSCHQVNRTRRKLQ